MSRSLTFRLETKMPRRQTPSSKKKAVVFTTVTMSAYQYQLKDAVTPNSLIEEESCRVYNCDNEKSVSTLDFQKYVKYLNFVA